MAESPTGHRSRWATAGGWLAVLLAVGLVGLPLFELLRTALGEGWGAAGEALTGAGPAVCNTVWTGLASMVLSVVIGTLAALITERTPVRGRSALRVGFLLPLMIPPFVSALSWAQAYGPGGLTDDAFGWALPGLFGGGGVVAVISVSAVPLAYLVVAAGLATGAAPDLERAARVSGASPGGMLRTVTLPLLRPALIGAAALTFVVSVNSFGIPAVLGLPAGFGTMTTRIYQDLARSAAPPAFIRVLVLSAALVVIAVSVVSVVDVRVGLSRLVVRTGAQSAGEAARRKRWGPAVAGWGYVTLTTLVPFVALVLTSLTRAVGLPMTPANWTPDNFVAAVSGRFGGALARSLGLAAVAATAVVLLGGLAASLERRRSGRFIATAAVSSFAVPGSALAVAMLLAYGSWLRDTLAIILVAYLAKFWSLGHRSIAGSVDALAPDLYRAARSSGAKPTAALRTVVVPLLAPAVGAAWAVVFLFSFHELTMSSLLYGPGRETLAVMILNLRQLGDVQVTAALAVVLTVVVLVGVVPLLALRLATGRRAS